MSEIKSGSEPSRLGCVVSLCLILLPAVAFSVFVEPLPAEEWPFALFWGAIFALPFGYLALATRAWIPWGVTSILTVSIWGALILAIGIQEQPGVNFGIVVVMLAAPIVITATAAAAVHFTKARN